MRASSHLRLFVLAVVLWAVFWVAGWPAYYQQYSLTFLIIGCAVITPPIIIGGLYPIARAKPERRMTLAFWLSFYFTVPFVALDLAYCGIYLGHGLSFFAIFWYLTLFYLLPWLVFPPYAYLTTGARS